MPEPQSQGQYGSSDIPNLSESGYRAYAYGEGQSPLTEPARKIGWMLGTIIARLEEIKHQAQQRIDEAKTIVREKSSETGGTIGESLDDAKQTTRQKLNEARFKAAQLRRRAVQDYPLQVILGAGVAGILVGVGLRAWKENRG